MSRRAKHSDAVMTGILVTKFKMGLIDVEDLEEMATDTTTAERCSAAKKVLDAVRDSPEVQPGEGPPRGGSSSLLMAFRDLPASPCLPS